MTYNKWQRWKGIMKAQPFEEKRLSKWMPPYIVQPKFDGFRCRAVPVEGGGYLLLSSEENVIHSAPHILKSLNENPHISIELDGELYNHQMYLEGGFDLISSVASRTTNLHPRHEELQFHVFDTVNSNSQIKRIIDLTKIHLPKYCYSVQYWVCENLEEIVSIYKELILYGYEGIIVRNISAPYERKRSLWVMKFKPKKSDTYKIVGWNEEVSIDGVPKGRIGSLIFSSQEGELFSSGAGLNDLEKDRLWNEREELIGKSAVVHYQHITSRGVPKFTMDIDIID